MKRLHEAGGVLIYGIPAFRLPKDVVAAELDGLRQNNVEFRTNWVGGRTVSVQQLFDEGYKAVFIGVGAGLPQFLGIPGENLIGVFSANEYLTRVNLGRAYDFPNFDTPTYPGKHVTVFGAGNVAMDAARTALRLGAESSTIIYRRSRAEMPARHEEIEHAEEEGVQLFELVGPLHFNASESGVLKSVTLQRMALGEPDASGRRRPMPIEGEVFDARRISRLWPWGHAPTRSCLKRRLDSNSTSAATSSSMKRRAKRPFRTSSPAAIL